MKPFVLDIDFDNLPESGFFTDETMYGRLGPSWSTRNVSTTFFGRSVNWLQQYLKEGRIVLDGVPIQVPRLITDDRPRWRLCDVERAAHALAQNGLIDTTQLVRVIQMVRLIAETYGFIDDQGESLLAMHREVKGQYPQIREWARTHSLPVGTRGRLPMPIVSAYLRDQKEIR